MVGPADGEADAAMPTEAGWVGVDGRRRPATGADRMVRLWHPAEATETEIISWRSFLATISALDQPIRQVDRETFRPLERDRGLAADRRFAGRIVDHGQLRAILRQRGWAAPFVGSWDQGHEATAWRVFDNSLRVELRYQAVDHLVDLERHERVRILGAQFVSAAGTAPASPASDVILVGLADLPPRIFSEALRDVSLAVAVGEAGAEA